MMDNRPVLFEEIIRDARTRHHPPLTQEGLADLLGMRQPSVSAWETGKTRPELPTLKRLADILGLDLGDLTTAAAEPLPEIPYAERVAAAADQ